MDMKYEIIKLVEKAFGQKMAAIIDDPHTKNGYCGPTYDGKIVYTDILGPVFDKETLEIYTEIAEDLYSFFEVEILILLFADKNIVVLEPEGIIESEACFKIQLAVAE